MRINAAYHHVNNFNNSSCYFRVGRYLSSLSLLLQKIRRLQPMGCRWFDAASDTFVQQGVDERNLHHEHERPASVSYQDYTDAAKAGDTCDELRVRVLEQGVQRVVASRQCHCHQSWKNFLSRICSGSDEFPHRSRSVILSATHGARCLHYMLWIVILLRFQQPQKVLVNVAKRERTPRIVNVDPCLNSTFVDIQWRIYRGNGLIDGPPVDPLQLHLSESCV